MGLIRLFAVSRLALHSGGLELLFLHSNVARTMVALSLLQALAMETRVHGGGGDGMTPASQGEIFVYVADGSLFFFEGRTLAP